jgi:hypothetical protein
MREREKGERERMKEKESGKIRTSRVSSSHYVTAPRVSDQPQDAFCN